MSFDEILDQVRELLYQRGRLSYGALKRRFDLDDAYVEDIKTELIKAERVAADENGEVLVWTGGDRPASSVQSLEPNVRIKQKSKSKVFIFSTEYPIGGVMNAAIRNATYEDLLQNPHDEALFEQNSPSEFKFRLSTRSRSGEHD
jgi:hypothetical protein